jgi:hypothetical protein
MPGMMTSLIIAAALLASPGAGGGTTPPDGVPVPVRVGLYVVDISNINETSSTFAVELDVVGGWKDTRLAFDGEEAHMYIGQRATAFRENIWLPQVSAVNVLGEMVLKSLTFKVEPDGSVVLRGRIAGVLRAPLDYHDFPFDRQVLAVELESFAWDASEVVIIPDAKYDGFDPDFHMPEWEIVDVRASERKHKREGDGLEFSRMRFEIEVRRMSGYYVWKVLLPLVIVVLISWIVFYMPNEALGRRAAVSSTGVLTVIAYQFVVSGSLPRVPYLTQMDRMTLLSVATIGATMLVNMLVDRAKRTSAERALKIDRASRGLFPLVYFSMLALFFFSVG